MTLRLIGAGLSPFVRKLRHVERLHARPSFEGLIQEDRSALKALGARAVQRPRLARCMKRVEHAIGA
jgi:hypothetical protein